MKTIVIGAMLASSLVLSACGDNKAGDKAGNSTAAATGNSGSAAPAANGTGDAAASADATNQNFTIRNNTGQAINELYVSAVSTDNWEEDILGRDVLPNGEAATITFDRAESECNWDMRVVFEDGQSLEQRGVNLCQTGEVTVAS